MTPEPTPTENLTAGGSGTVTYPDGITAEEAQRQAEEADRLRGER